ncbi:TonB-dependent receptor [Nonlabens xiamenensis]|uniref:TonB-dependent receptor n=1 Tax=Nonlabens xiamenensis TaxID=2341043 RepID=UPI000F60CFBF|nr:TonB-dependent receptor [Nonlabens xiamenensis]
MKKLFFLILFFVTALVSAQNGTVAGLVTDTDYDDEPVAFASVQLKGTTLGAQTDMDGKFRIVAPVGTYTLIVSFVGMQTVEIPDVKINEGFTTTINVPMSAEAAALEAIEITVTKSRESAEALILEKKNAITIKQSIGAEELSQKGVSDAEGAVTKVSGVSKQSGVKNVFVRGLGDRYNSTTLNSLPLPSDDPEYKNISLDFFGSDLLESVDINKVFTSEITGDNAGANINIDMKGLTGKRALDIGLATGINTQTIGEDFKGIDGEGFFGFSEEEVPVDNLSVYSFNNQLAPETNDASPNLGLSIAGGKRFDIGDNHLNVYGLLTFDNGYRFTERTVRNTNSAGVEFFDLDGVNYDYGTSQIAMGNLNYVMGKNNIELISMYIHKNTQSFQEYEGINNPEQEGDRIFLRRQQTNNNNVYVNQLLTNFALSDRLDLEVKASFNAVRGSEPDRRDFEYLFRDGFYSPNIDSGGNNQRYFSEVQENDFNGIANLKFDLNTDAESDLAHFISLNTSYRYTHHIFKATTFNHTVNNRIEVDIDNPDAFYSQPSLVAGNFRLETGRGSAINPNAFDPFYYLGDKYTITGGANYVKQFSDKFLINLGGRFENIEQEVEYNTNIARSSINGPSIIEESFFLPSLGLKYNLNEDNIIRFGASQTYMLPRFKEIAPFRYDGVQFSIQGNPDLEASTILNFDLAYEYYPSKGELISLTGFYKNINDPVSRVEIPSAGNTLTYLNVGETATVLGAEFELRKDVWTKELAELEVDAPRNATFTVGFNASYIYSKQDLDDPLAQFSEESTQLQGAAPLLLNLDLNYSTFFGHSKVNTAMVLNYFSDRVYSVGTRGFENITEVGVPTLDFVGSLGIGENGKLSLKAKNILNPEIQLEREGLDNNTVLSSYTRGVNISLGYSYKF